MYGFFMTIHVTACVLLILVVLLQAGRGAGLGVFGGGGGDNLFTTPTTTGFMKKFTAWLAATFACTSFLLAWLSSRSSLSSVTNQAPYSRPAPSPVEGQPSGAPAQSPAPEAKQPKQAAPAKK